MKKKYTLNILNYGNLSVYEDININQVYNLLYKDKPINFSIVLYEIINNKVSQIYTKCDNRTDQVLLYDYSKLKAIIKPCQKIKKEQIPTFNNNPEYNILFNVGTYEDGIIIKRKLNNIIKYLEDIEIYDLEQYYILLEDIPYIIKKVSKENYQLINPYTQQKNKLQYQIKDKKYLKYQLEKV